MKYKLLKFIYSVIGFFKLIFFFRIDEEYIGGIKQNASSRYVGNLTFQECFHAVEQNYGVCVYTQRKKTYKLWELGLFKWIKK